MKHMKLQDVLNYRHDCLICGNKMIIKNMNMPRLSCTIKLSCGSLVVKSRHIKGIHLKFNLDGSYKKGKKDYPNIYNKSLFMTKICSKCHVFVESNPHFVPFTSKGVALKGRSLGWIEKGNYPLDTYTSLNNIKSLCCAYNFTIYTHEDDYDVVMNTETIRYCTEESFHHINTEFENSTKIYQGKYNSPFDKILSLNLPPVNMSGIKNVTELLDKIKLYNTFS